MIMSYSQVNEFTSVHLAVVHSIKEFNKSGETAFNITRMLLAIKLVIILSGAQDVMSFANGCYNNSSRSIPHRTISNILKEHSPVVQFSLITRAPTLTLFMCSLVAVICLTSTYIPRTVCGWQI